MLSPFECLCGNFILPEPASYVFFYAVFNLRKLLYIIIKKMICFQTIRKGLTMQTTVSSEKKYAPPKRSEKQIGNTTFIVNSFFREKGDEGIAVKLERLMKADVQKEATT